MRALAAVAAILPAIACAQEDADADVRLRVKPVLCITDDRNPSCDLGFLVTWQSAGAGHYCLFNDFSDEPLRCWRESSEAQLTDDRSVDESFSYWMTGEDFTNRLAQAEVEVLRFDSDDRRRRRRTRHVWDIQ